MCIARWMDKEDVVYIYDGILLNHKREWNNAICSYMDGPRDYHISEVRERQIWYHFYGKSKKNDTNKIICKIETDSQT